MHETISHFNTLYTVLTLIFACGVSYATIKVSLKSMTEQVKKLEEKVEKLETNLKELEIEKRMNGLRFDQIQRTLSDIDSKLSRVSEFYFSMEKRGSQQWQQTQQPATPSST